MFSNKFRGILGSLALPLVGRGSGLSSQIKPVANKGQSVLLRCRAATRCRDNLRDPWGGLGLQEQCFDDDDDDEKLKHVKVW